MLGRVFAAALAVASTIAAVLPSAANAEGRLTIGTNPQGTLYYTIGGGLAAALQDALGHQVTLQPFTGSSVYVPLIAEGEVTMGLNSSIDVGGWYRGDYGNEPYTNLRVLARLWPLRQALIARADSGMTAVSDLTGKRVVTKLNSQTATGKVNVAILEAGGLSLDEVEGVSVAGLKQGIDALVENGVDATGIAVGIPLTQQAHATIPGGIRYLSITGDKATNAAINGFFNGVYLTEVAPNQRMPEVTEPVTVAAYDVFLTVSADLPSEQATAILNALYDSLPQLKADYPALAAAEQDLLSAPSNTIPFHPASVVFFKARGMWSNANEEREAAIK